MYIQHKRMYTHIPIYHKCVHTHVTTLAHTTSTHKASRCTCRYTHHTTNMCMHVHTHRGQATWEGISTEKEALCGSAPEHPSRQSGGSAAAIRAPPSRRSSQRPLPGQWRQKTSPRSAESSFVTFMSVQKYSESCVWDHLIYLSLIFPRAVSRAL